MNTGEILTALALYILFSLIIFKVAFINKDSNGKMTFYWNKLDLILFGKILIILSCLPIFSTLGIYTFVYHTVIKEK